MSVNPTPEAHLRKIAAQRELTEGLRRVARRRTRVRRWTRRLIRH